MSEERRQVHPEEPAEGAEEDVAPPGVEHASGDKGVVEGLSAEERSSEHTQEPAEWADEDVAPPGAEHSSG